MSILDETEDDPSVARLDAFVDRLGAVMRDKRTRASFALYMMGLLSESERKSVEPLAALHAGDDPRCAQRAHDNLLHFVSSEAWEDAPLRAIATGEFLAAAASMQEPVEVSIVDDTGFLKQGKKSPGVQRQYTGSAGKIANCQIGVSLTIATRTQECPVDMKLYIPESWTADPARCRAAKIPEGVGYRPKWQLALEMIRGAHKTGVPLGIILGDSAYGDVSDFRCALFLLGVDYALDVRAPTRVRAVDAKERARGQSVLDFARALPPETYRKVTWREGTRGPLSSRFARVDVQVKQGGLWMTHTLVIDWPDGQDAPEHYTLVRADRIRSLTTKELVRLIRQRWRTERVYQDAKGEFGLDHYEGRSYVGWNHHVTAVFCCYAFVASERLRRFSPSDASSLRPRTHQSAA